VVLCLVWAANAVASLLQHWVSFLYGLRSAIGLRPPVAGPDYFILGGMLALVLLAIASLAVAYSAIVPLGTGGCVLCGACQSSPA